MPVSAKPVEWRRYFRR